MPAGLAVGRPARNLAAALFCCLLLSCDFLTGPDDGLPVPQQTNDGWRTASPARVGMDPGPLEDLLDRISGTPDHRLHSLLIVRNGKLVFEEYWPGTDLLPGSLEPVGRYFDRETLHYVASVSKSITSALVGIAQDRGLLDSVDVPVFEFFPEHAALENDANENITLRHLLSFTSGYDWNEFVYGFGDPRDSHYQMFNTADPLGYLLGRAVTTEPGAVFHYNSGDTNLMGEVVRRVTSSSTLVDFADANLFQPLGIEDYDWIRLPLDNVVTFASGGASLRPRDMAKLGALYLNGGTWNGTGIVSSAWVDTSTQMSIPLAGSYRSLYGYGFNWWLGRSTYRDRKVDYFRASGWGGQNICVFPELEMVVVFTAGAYYEALGLSLDDLLEDYILQAVRE
ncbi:MAG: serine hydrolase [Gemmatimonadota bacterium]